MSDKQALLAVVKGIKAGNFTADDLLACVPNDAYRIDTLLCLRAAFDALVGKAIQSAINQTE